MKLSNLSQLLSKDNYTLVRENGLKTVKLVAIKNILNRLLHEIFKKLGEQNKHSLGGLSENFMKKISRMEKKYLFCA